MPGGLATNHVKATMLDQHITRLRAPSACIPVWGPMPAAATHSHARLRAVHAPTATHRCPVARCDSRWIPPPEAQRAASASGCTLTSPAAHAMVDGWMDAGLRAAGRSLMDSTSSCTHIRTRGVEGVPATPRVLLAVVCGKHRAPAPRRNHARMPPAAAVAAVHAGAACPLRPQQRRAEGKGGRCGSCSGAA